MRPSGTPKQLEKRRRRAVQLLESGQSLSAVARQSGAAVSSVFRWRQTYRRKGTRGLEAKLIHRKFGVRYHPAHVWKVLTGLGWSCQKPERRAVERDEDAIARWTRDEWRRIKKRRATWRPSRIR